MTRELPAQFADLESWSAWALDSQELRYSRRRCSTMSELKAFYDALLPRMDGILRDLNAQPLGELEGTNATLMSLALAFIEVSLAIELFEAPDELAAMPADRFTIATGALGRH